MDGALKKLSGGNAACVLQCGEPTFGECGTEHNQWECRENTVKCELVELRNHWKMQNRHVHHHWLFGVVRGLSTGEELARQASTGGRSHGVPKSLTTCVKRNRI